jgi:hypothetical protein
MIPDILLIAFSLLVIPSLYFLGRHARNAQREDRKRGQ